jgi:3-phenylpropionate/trans-cinnamate dioxygenase ferredoxin subunit
MARHILGAVSEFPVGSRRRVEVEGRAIGIFNLKGEFFALLDRCPHEGGSLCRGDVVGLLESDDPGRYRYTRHGEMVKCPWHGWEYDIRTGQSWCEPARTKVRTYPISVATGDELVKGPYKVETFSVKVEEDYVVLDL